MKVYKELERMLKVSEIKMSVDKVCLLYTSDAADDSKWDGLKGYLTNTEIPIQDVYTAYHNLWHVERAFRIAKSKIEIRPMFHFTRKRIASASWL